LDLNFESHLGLTVQHGHGGPHGRHIDHGSRSDMGGRQMADGQTDRRTDGRSDRPVTRTSGGVATGRWSSVVQHTHLINFSRALAGAS
jgi:hypothetical protein